MVKEKRYILDWETRGINSDGEKYYNPRLSGEHVKDKKLFFKTDKKYYDKVYEKDWIFDYLEPRMLTQSVAITHICDFHTWIQRSPRNIHRVCLKHRILLTINKIGAYFFVKLHENMYIWGQNLCSDYEKY